MLTVDTTKPQNGYVACVSSDRTSLVTLRFSGSPANRTQRNSLIRRAWATSPRLPSLHFSRAPRSRTEILLLPRQACSHLHLRPNPCYLASSPCGSRTQPRRLEKPMTSPEVERAVLHRVVFPRVRAPGAQSGPGGARILVCGSSDRR